MIQDELPALGIIPHGALVADRMELQR